MYNFVIISPIKCASPSFSTPSPPTRCIQYYDCEEGIAAISNFGNLLSGAFIYAHTSFLSGIDLYSYIKKQFPHLPILLLSHPDSLHKLNTIETSTELLGSNSDISFFKTHLKKHHLI